MDNKNRSDPGPSVGRRGFFRRLMIQGVEKFEQVGERFARSVSNAEGFMADSPISAGAEQVRYLRPPGSLPETLFQDACTRCGDCITACPANCITVDEAGSHQATFPHILARQSPCVVCTDLSCMKVCPTDALSLLEVGQINMGYAVLNDMTCLRGPGGDQEDCRLCIESCPRGEEAISVDQYHGIIEIRDGCIGCGVCEHACPTDPASIWVEPRMDF